LKLPSIRDGVRPLKAGTFSGVVAVPRKYFTEWRTEQEALEAFLDDFEDNPEAAMSATGKVN
jgi:hypothetical protein